jgi:hypothetical protein
MTEKPGESSSSRDEANSPLHPGERAIQESVGVREKNEPFGGRGIRDHMPEHREFFGKLRI